MKHKIDLNRNINETLLLVLSFKIRYLEELGKAHREVAEKINLGFFEREGNTIIFIMEESI